MAPALAVAALGALCAALVTLAGHHRRLAVQLHRHLSQLQLSPAGSTSANLSSIARVALEAQHHLYAAEADKASMQSALEGLASAVLLFDAHGELRLANEGGRRLLSGRHGDALVMTAVRELLASPVSRDADTAFPGEEGCTSRVVELAGPPKGAFELRVRLLHEGTRLVTVENITERRRLEEVRRDFVANISHELKTPIGAIAVLAEAMTTEDEPESLARLSLSVHREALRVGSTIDDLLLLSRIESDHAPVEAAVDLAEVVDTAIARVAHAAVARGIGIRVECEAGPLLVMGDARQLVSAVYNLLENAVKYSEDGSDIVAGVQRRETDVVVRIVDHGMGIPARDLDRVFERFYRVDRARSRRTGGTGLGLAIVRHVAQNHGGSVQVSSQEGEGSTFSLILPGFDHTPSAPTAPTAPSAPTGPTAEEPALRREMETL